MHRRAETERLGRFRWHVMHLPIRQDNHTANARRRHVAEGFVDRRENARGVLTTIVFGLSSRNGAHVKFGEPRQLCLQRFHRSVRISLACAKFLALAFIHYDGDGAFQRRAFFTQKGRVGERRNHRRARAEAQQAATALAENEHACRSRQHSGGDCNHQPWQ